MRSPQMTTSARMWLTSVGTGGAAPTPRAATTVHVSLDTHQRDWLSSSPTTALNASVMYDSVARYFRWREMCFGHRHTYWQRTWRSKVRCICGKAVTTQLGERQGCVWTVFSLVALRRMNVLELLLPFGLSPPSHLLFWATIQHLLLYLQKNNNTFTPCWSTKYSCWYPTRRCTSFNAVQKRAAFRF